MTIRIRLTLWYAGVMFISLVAMGVVCYFVFVRDANGHALKAASVTTNVISEDAAEDFRNSFDIIFWCGVPAGMLALAGGWWLMRKALLPVTTLTQAAERINESNLHVKLPSAGTGDELDRLTQVFNSMTTRLDGSFQRIREFTLHASHELKTPLTILHGEIETALRTEPLSAEQRERAAGQLDEIQRLTKIVDGLTLLTKADAGQVALKFETVSLDEIIRDVFADAQILARPANISVQLAACEEIKIPGDRHRLRQLLLNLADNAVKYNQPGGTIEFSLQRKGAKAELKLSNTGQSIPQEILPRVFERFFRGDAAHHSAVEGCGLGLSIAQWITTAHQGTITIESEPAKLTTVTVCLPLTA